MAEELGSGVSRTLSALQRQFALVVWQKGRPPLDSELNLVGQIALEQMRQTVRESMHSGFLLDPTDAQADFVTDPTWSNFFKLGRQTEGEEAPPLWANVNGWLIPITGTGVVDGDTSNRVDLFPPPSSDARTDFVFLEAWVAQVAPNPSATNKPATDSVWKHGNVEFGGTNISDDIEDPTIGYETTERLQIQYRLRVFGSGSGLGTSVALDDYPDGLGDPNILAQGPADSPVTGFSYTNMREALGDPSLWRAGDGDATNDLGTYDGYVYAIPVAAIFRRNSSTFVAVESAGAPNQNGAYNRNPSASTLTNPQEGTKAFTTARLLNDISETDVGLLQMVNLSGSGFDDPNLAIGSVFMVIDDEVIEISAVNAATTPGTITVPVAGRGRYGTMAVPHSAGAEVKFFNSRPDGLFADQISSEDILDLRRGVTFGEWDYEQLLMHNLSKLLRGDLRTTWKQSGAGDTEGPVITEVSTLLANGAVAVPQDTAAVDGPDGIRTVFSDAAALQPDVTVLIDADASAAAGFVSNFVPTTDQWSVAADFVPSGFVTGNGFSSGISDNSVIFLNIGGADGTSGARSTFRDGSERAVRFVSPKEYWKTEFARETTGNQHPVTVNFLDERAMVFEAGGESATAHPGPLYPLKTQNFEKPFLFLGGVIHPDLDVSSIEVYNDSPNPGEYEVRLPGLNFDTAGDWFSKTGTQFNNDPSALNNPVLNGTRTLYDMLTAGGVDFTGASSEVYLVLWGDDTDARNNGAFKVIGAGSSAGYTFNNASAPDRLRVSFIRPPSVADGFAPPADAALLGQVRSQYTNAEDGTVGGAASACIVFTDVSGESGGALNPWNSFYLSPEGLELVQPLEGRAVIRMALQYHPGRGAMPRVPDSVERIAVVGAGSEYLRQSPTGAARDTGFAAATGVASNETYFDVQSHVQTWNRLSSRGLDGREAPAHGGSLVAFTEQDREGEALYDKGSKTLVFRPFLNRNMTLRLHQIDSGALIPSQYPASYSVFDVDGAGIFTLNRDFGYPVPWEYMPRFGRQDIPYKLGNTGQFLDGINHLFTDSQDNTAGQFNIVGGENGVAVQSMRIQTGAGSGLLYGAYGTITGTTTSGYQGRLLIDNTVQSSDLGTGLKGIQLPPFLGVARVYGVYDLRDYQAAGGSTFESDRITKAAGAPPNLLRTDATKQTLFIVQGGASDVTDNEDDHTYVIPQNAFDITLSDSYVAGETFEDLEYVVECVVFGFARGWINKNNYVLARGVNGEGNSAETELAPAEMCIPAAAPRNDQMYVAYRRTPYQGDPYQTRAGETQTISDYVARYGQVQQSDAYQLSSAIQQFDSDGNVLIETPNLRSFQVLSSVEFYTTMGTGKIGGDLFAGTPTDVGYVTDTPTAATRVPAASDSPNWRVESRAFSEGQVENPSRASIALTVVDGASLLGTGAGLRIFTAGGSTVTLNEGSDWTASGSEVATANSIAAAINGAASLAASVVATGTGTATVVISAVPAGVDGGEIRVGFTSEAVGFLTLSTTSALLPLTATNSFLKGGTDLVVNAGNGSSSLDLTGMTERLPLGILLQDSDFLNEDPLNNRTSALSTAAFGVRPVQMTLPLTNGQEYTRLLGGAGNWIAMADGAILQYTAFDETLNPTGSKRFRLYRGASSFVLTGPRPGGPLDWVSGVLPARLSPVLKGGVLAGKAMLVRSFHEAPFSPSRTVTDGDEIQMVIATRGLLGKGNLAEEGLSITGILSPTGYGEGYAAADRYRLEGKPMARGAFTTPRDPNVELALFPFDDPVAINTEC